MVELPCVNDQGTIKVVAKTSYNIYGRLLRSNCRSCSYLSLSRYRFINSTKYNTIYKILTFNNENYN